MADQQDSAPLQKTRLFSGARKEWRFVFKFLAFSFVFWILQFAYQFYFLIPGEVGGSLVRSFALSGATFIGLALLSSSVFKWRPSLAKYWYVRRSLGVMGWFFISLHILTVIGFLFQGDTSGIFYSLNPFQNPIIFGVLAFPIFFLMAMTSTDWAVEKLGFRKWKAIHRLVYFGYLFAIFHFLLINPALLMNPAGYLLLVVTFLALAGQLFWFLKIASRKKFSTLGSGVGFLVIFLWLLLGYLAFLAPTLMTSDVEGDIQRMKDFMENNPLPVPDKVTPEERQMGGTVLKAGQFQNLNYMSSGTATLFEKDGKHFVSFGEDFSTPNGPDLVVYLTTNSAPTTRQDISSGIILGELRALSGRQVYQIPAGTNVQDYNSVTIHCRAFNVPWSFAPLG